MLCNPAVGGGAGNTHTTKVSVNGKSYNYTDDEVNALLDHPSYRNMLPEVSVSAFRVKTLPWWWGNPDAIDGMDANQGWPFSSKSNPASWVFTTARTNKNVQTAAVYGIELKKHDIRYNVRRDDLTIIAIHLRLPTVYFEYPKVTNMFFKKNEKLYATYAALIMARATDRAIKQTQDWIDGQDDPTEWNTEIELMKNLTKEVVKDGGRVTPTPNYFPVKINPYRTL